MAHEAPTPRGPRPALLLGGLVLLGVLVVQLAMIGSYVGSLHRPQPHELPVAVVAPTAQVAQLQQQVGDRLDLRAVSSDATARAELHDGDIYAALEPAVSGAPTLLVANAKGPSAVSAVEQVLAAGGTQATVQDVVPLDDNDPRGLSSFYLVLGWIVGGYLAATALGIGAGMAATTRRTAAARLGLLTAYALASGILGAALVGPWTGILPLPFLATAAAGTLVVLATAAATTAVTAGLGLLGTGVVILAFVVLGNPSSGGPFSYELLPALPRAIGAWLPPGAGTDLVRDLTYFDGSGVLRPLLVLGAYLVVGVSLTLVATGRRWPLVRIGVRAAD